MNSMNLHLELTKLEGSLKNSKLKMTLNKNGKRQEDKEGSKKKEFYKQLVSSYTQSWKKPPLWYKQRLEQYDKSLATLNCRKLMISGISPLVIGHGQISVLETHLTLHKIYGVPYIPGTAIKGVAAHYCHQYLGRKNPAFKEGGDYYNVLFGSQEEASLIHYHDAFPTLETVSNAIDLDVLTPHHQKYNQIVLNQNQPEKAHAPRDDDSPVPIYFLSVKADFQVILTSESQLHEDEEWLAIAEKITIQAIQQEGLGGKTNAGYGRFLIKSNG